MDENLLSYLLDQARQVVARVDSVPQYSVKSDGSLVTAVDRAVEGVLRRILASERPDDGVWGEEYGKTSGSSDYIWIIDPIDGTHAFMMGRPWFTILIGLVYKRKFFLGGIDQPTLGHRWIGTLSQTTWNGRLVRTRPCAELKEAFMSSTHPDMLVDARPLTKAVKTVIYGGDAYAYALLASGRQDIILEAGLKIYDYSALIPVITGAGGVITDWSGNDLTLESDGKVLAVGDPRIHEQAIRLLSPRP